MAVFLSLTRRATPISHTDPLGLHDPDDPRHLGYVPIYDRFGREIGQDYQHGLRMLTLRIPIGNRKMPCVPAYQELIISGENPDREKFIKFAQDVANGEMNWGEYGMAMIKHGIHENPAVNAEFIALASFYKGNISPVNRDYVYMSNEQRDNYNKWFRLGAFSMLGAVAQIPSVGGTHQPYGETAIRGAREIGVKSGAGTSIPTSQGTPVSPHSQRPLSERIAEFRGNPEKWERVAVQASKSRSYPGGINLENSYVNKHTGETLHIHELYDRNLWGVPRHPSYRDYGKSE